MPKALLLSLLLAPAAAMAQELPWPASCAKVHSLTSQRRLVTREFTHSSIAMPWREREVGLAAVAGKPRVRVSPEYAEAQDGRLVVGQAIYSADCRFPPDDPEIIALRAKSAAGTLTPADFRGPRWVHLVKPIDEEEERCVQLHQARGRWSGCGDVWQDGLNDNEVVCFQGKSYPRCHVECVQSIYRRLLTLQQGYCRGGAE